VVIVWHRLHRACSAPTRTRHRLAGQDLRRCWGGGGDEQVWKWWKGGKGFSAAAAVTAVTVTAVPPAWPIVAWS
jgi:hypothetical protein